MELVLKGDPRLTATNARVEIDEDLKDWCLEVEDFIKKLPAMTGKGVAGLAAPQVGRNIRAFWALGNWYINPEIYYRPKGGKKRHLEGCFSVPGGEHPVWRDYKINMRWDNLDGTSCDHEGITGYLAQVLQHEYDHLEGKLCCDQ